MRALVPILCCLSCQLSAAEPDPSTELVAAWEAGVAQLTAAYQAYAGEAADAYGREALEVDLEAVAELIDEARDLVKDGAAETAKQAWLEVLRIDIQQPEARAYFETLGQLDQALDQALGAGAPAADAADLLGGGTAVPAPRVVPEAFAGIVAEREEALGEALAEFREREAKARDRFAKAEARLRDKVVSKLGSLGKRAARKGDLPAASAAWRAALRLDRGDEDAIDGLREQGALEAVLADLGDEITVGTLLGPVPEPSAGFVGLRGDGRRVALIKRGDSPLQAAIVERLERLGFVIDDTGMGDDGFLDDTALVLAVETSDATYGRCSAAADYGTLPLVVVHPKLLKASRRIPGDQQYTHEAVDRHAEIADPTHPIAARMSGRVEILGPAAEQRDVVVALRGYQADVTQMGAEAQVVVTLDGAPAIVAWEADSAFEDPASKREQRKDRIEQERGGGRLVGCFLFTGADPDLLTRDAWRLFDAAVAWALAR